MARQGSRQSPRASCNRAGQTGSGERERKRVADLERLVARQALEIDFFKGALQRVEERRRKREETSGTASTSKSGK